MNEKKKKNRCLTSSKFTGGLELGEGKEISGNGEEGSVLVGGFRDRGQVMDFTKGVGVLDKDTENVT